MIIKHDRSFNFMSKRKWPLLSQCSGFSSESTVQEILQLQQLLVNPHRSASVPVTLFRYCQAIDKSGLVSGSLTVTKAFCHMALRPGTASSRLKCYQDKVSPRMNTQWLDVPTISALGCLFSVLVDARQPQSELFSGIVVHREPIQRTFWLPSVSEPCPP